MKVFPVTCWKPIPSRLPSNVKRVAVALFKDCAPDIENHMKAKAGVDRRETSHLVLTLLLPTLTVTGYSYLFPRNLRLCQASSTHIASVAELLAQLRLQRLPGASGSFSAHVPQLGWDQNLEPTLCSVTRTIRKGSNQSSAGAG